METIHKGRKIVTAVRHVGHTWLIETTIWPAPSHEEDDPQVVETIGAPGQTEDEAHAKGIHIGQHMIDASCI